MLVNPWNGGFLVNLDAYPRLKAYLGANGHRLRSPARRPPQAGIVVPYDRQGPPVASATTSSSCLTSRPTLTRSWTTASSIRRNIFIVSDRWDLEVLGGLLLSDVATSLIGAYCVKIRGGCYHFQAQYLRRMRLPEPSDIDRALRMGWLARSGHEIEKQPPSCGRRSRLTCPLVPELLSAHQDRGSRAKVPGGPAFTDRRPRRTSEVVALSPRCRPLRQMYLEAEASGAPSWNQVETGFLTTMSAFDTDLAATGRDGARG